MRRLALLLLAACGSDADVTPMPVADAGFDFAVQVGDDVELDGGASYSPDGATLAYRWGLALRPLQSAAELRGSDSAAAGLRPDVPGTYIVTLVVLNGDRESLPDVVAIEASNQPPIAQASCRAGSSCRVLHGRSEVLDGRSTFDPDGDALSYSWSQITAAADCAATCPTLAACEPHPGSVTLTDSSLALAGFAAPDLEDLQLVFRLDVSDGSSSGTACVRYTTYNTAPIIISVTATPNQVDEDASFTLSSSSGDSDSDGLTLLWEQCEPAPAPCTPLAGSTPVATLNTPLASNSTARAPTVTANTTLRFRLTVSDGIDTVQSGLVNLLVRNVF